MALGKTQYAFFMLPSRAWELLAGSIVSQVTVSVKKKSLLSFLGIVGLALIFIPYFFYSDSTAFPGLTALPTVVGAALVILFGEKSFTGRILSSKPSVAIGKVSYSLYLWHWPVFVILAALWSQSRWSAGQTALAVLIVAAATMISYRYVELPVRRSKAFNTFSAFTLLGAGSIVVICLSLFFIYGIKNYNGELPSAWNGKPTWRPAQTGHKPHLSNCTYEQLVAENSPFLIQIGNLHAKPSFALWGDSFALALLPGVDRFAAEYGRSGFFINMKQSLTALPLEDGTPLEDREPIFSWLKNRPDIEDVYLVSKWREKIQHPQDITVLTTICIRLKAYGKRVYFFDDPPPTNNRALQPFSLGLKGDPAKGAISTGDYQLAEHWQLKAVDRLVRQKLATIVPTEKAFLQGDKYFTTTELNSYYADIDHVNTLGAVKAVKYNAALLWSTPRGN